MKLTPAALAAKNLENFMVAATQGGIERQEAAGQAAFVGKQSLPFDCPKSDLEKLGFVFGEPIDDLFVSVTFPPGWSKKADDHSMWSHLLDDKGRKRGSIFYKAAFYDRRARMRYLDCRYSPTHAYASDPAIPEQYHVEDQADKSYPFIAGVCLYSDRARRDELEAACITWLQNNKPDWKNPLAYWD